MVHARPLEVELVPSGAPGLDGTGGCQDEELQAAGRAVGLRQKIRHQLWDLPIRHGGEVLDGPDLVRGGKHLVQHTPPPGRIFTRAQPVDVRPVEDRLHALADACGRLGLRGPDGREDGLHVGQTHRVRGLVANMRQDEVPKRVLPLLGVLGVAPAGTFGGDQGFSAVPEGRRGGGDTNTFRHQRGRVTAVSEGFAHVAGESARARERPAMYAP